MAEVNVRDKTGYEKEFLPPTLKTMKEAGGKYLAGGFDKAVGPSGIRTPITAGSSVVVSIHAGMHACGPSGEHQQRSRLTVAAR